MSQKLTTEEFIKRAREVHGDKYDYSQVEYVDSKTKVCIICKEHGEFWQRPSDHRHGKECPFCEVKRQGKEQSPVIVGINLLKKKLAGYWTYERCLEEAKKYSLKADFKLKAAGAYDVSKDRGWLEEFTWLKSRSKVKWTYKTCYDEAKKYKTRSEFAKKAGAAYRTARKNGWFDEYTWFIDIVKPTGYWTYETCFEEARKYKTRWHFSKGCQTAYQRAKKEKWIDDYTWFVSDSTPAGYWTYEKCYVEAKKYRTRTELNKKAGYIYKLALQRGWLDDYTWLEKKFEWTYDTCLEIARQYKTKREFELGNKRAYGAAIRHGWIKNFSWMVKARVNVMSDNVDNVYMYYFDKYNAVYVGRTINVKKRDRQHLFDIDKDAVAKFALEHNCAVPPIIILEDCLTLEQGQDRENYWVNYYREHGYNVLNKAPTGIGVSSLGNIAGIKWSKKKCYEEAKLYSCRKAFQCGSVGAYTLALKRGWLEDYTWFKRPQNWNQKWDRESCYEEALKYNRISKFEDNSPGAYRAAKKNGWLVDYTWIEYTVKPAGYWSYETCYEEAKRYKSRGELKKHARTAYRYALTNGWLDDYTWFVKKWELKWSKERCFDEANKYKSRYEFRKGCGSAYAAALRNGWLDEFFPKK